MPERFDLAVIGAGGAGSTVAFDAVNRNVKVAMIERWKVGGTCLNVGCDPTKTLVRSAAVAHMARHASRYGIEIPDVLGELDRRDGSGLAGDRHHPRR